MVWKKYKISCNGLNEEEAEFMKALFEQYRNRYNVGNFSDLRLLEELAYRETQQEFYKKLEKLDTETKETKGKKKLFNQYGDAMDENLDQMLLLREKLGMFEKEERQDGFTYIQALKKKFAIWEQSNVEQRKAVCPYCSKEFHVHLLAVNYELIRHPYFKNKTLYNDHLWKMWREGKITKEDIAAIVDVSPKYIEWADEHIYRKS